MLKSHMYDVWYVFFLKKGRKVMVKNKHMLLSLALLLVCAGCGKRGANNNDVNREVDIPMTDESFCSLFDPELDEFATELDVSEVASQDNDGGVYDFTWVEDTENTDGFKAVCFGFDRHGIADDQRAALDHNIGLVKARLAEDSEYRATVIIEGHSCHSAGQPWYNMLISERRAKCICDELVKAGIPQDCLKVVGRGAEMPAMMNDEVITGDRMEQAANRRCEIKVIYA